MNPGQEIAQLALPPRLKEVMIENSQMLHLYGQPIGNQGIPLVQQTQQQDNRWSTAIRPPTVNWQNQQRDPAIEQLTNQMSKMTDYLAELTKAQ
jgi:hypothetical protein